MSNYKFNKWFKNTLISSALLLSLGGCGNVTNNYYNSDDAKKTKDFVAETYQDAFADAEDIFNEDFLETQTDQFNDLEETTDLEFQDSFEVDQYLNFVVNDILAVDGETYDWIDEDGTDALANLDSFDTLDTEEIEECKQLYFLDNDNDGFGNILDFVVDCEAPAGYVSNPLDCDDTNPLINPDAIEGCNGIDDNCSGDIDEDVKSTFYLDNDSDNYGDQNQTILACQAPEGYLANNTDCNDANDLVHPNAVEFCDNLDNDCDGETDEIYNIGEDCSNGVGECEVAGVYKCAEDQISTECDAVPNQPVDELCDGLDNNCNNFIDEGLDEEVFYADLDADGYGDFNSSLIACSLPPEYVTNFSDCNDDDLNINPAVLEICDHIDNNCDGEIDEGYKVGDVCYAGTGQCENAGEVICASDIVEVADEDPQTLCTAVPIEEVPEICDGLDNDCDNLIDENFNKNLYEDNDGDGYGDPVLVVNSCPTPGLVENALDCDDTNPAINPEAVDICDYVDNDCDLAVDNEFVTGEECDLGMGECKSSGTIVCSEDGTEAICNAVPGEPSQELCDSLDNNCNGEIDESLTKVVSCDPYCLEDFVDLCPEIDVDKTCSNGKWTFDNPEQYENPMACDDLSSFCQDGEIVWKLSSGNSCSMVSLSPNGKTIYSVNNNKVDAIDFFGQLKGDLQIGNNLVKVPVIGNDGTIYVTDGSNLKAITEGQEAWSIFIGEGASSPVIGEDGTLYLTDSSPSDPENWSGSIKAVHANGTLKWSQDAPFGNTKAGLSFGPDGKIYAGADNGKLYALTTDGDGAWVHDFEGQLTKTATFGLENEVLISKGSKLYALDSETGEELWNKQANGIIKTDAVVDSQGDIYFATGTGKLYALNSSGNTKWIKEGMGTNKTPTLTKDGTLYLSRDNGLYAINSDDGTLEWKLEQGNADEAIKPGIVTVGKEGTVYFCNSENGDVYAVCEQSGLDPNASWPTWQHDSQHSGKADSESEE